MTFGTWTNDSQELPCYTYTGGLPWEENPSHIQEDPYFILGNDRLTVFPHVSGQYQLITGERSWMKINHRGHFTGSNDCQLQVGTGKTESLVGKESEAARNAHKTFGPGYARYAYTGSGYRCERLLSVCPGKELGSSVPVLRVDVILENTGDSVQTLVLKESVGICHRMLNTQYAPDDAQKIRYDPSIVRHDASCIRLTTVSSSNDPHRLVSIEARAKVDAHAPDVYMAVEGTDGYSVSAEQDSDKRYTLSSILNTSLEPGTSCRMTVYLGLCFPQQQDDPAKHLSMLKEADDPSSPIPYRKQWRALLPDFPEESDVELRREMIWNAYVLEAMATYSLYFKETFIPQGTVYDYGTGNTAAPRDHLQHALGVIAHHPELAKSCIRFVFNKELPNGCIVYTEQGYGFTSDMMWHTSDQQLYLIMALSEYCRISGDYAFLNEEVPYCFAGPEATGSVLDHIEQAFIYFRDEVGLGLHGLPRIMNSDWNDGIFYHRPLAPYFWSAVSHMNAAMAAVVLQDFVEILLVALQQGMTESERTQRLIDSVRAYRNQITEAYLKDMEGRTFSRRAWLTPDESIGSESMFLEPQGFLLQIPEFPLDRKQVLVEEIKTRLGGEALGCRHIERPQEEEGIMQAPGEGENAGMWYALQGPLILGVNEVYPDQARRMLKQMGMHHYATCFPHIWNGHWTGSDAVNTSFSPLEGEVNSQFLQLQEVPAFCAHPHAWALYAYHRIKNSR